MINQDLKVFNIFFNVMEVLNEIINKESNYIKENMISVIYKLMNI